MFERLFLNGCFLHLDPNTPEPRALLVRDGRIAAWSTDARPAGWPEAPAVDLGGRTVIPGPVDAHCHLVSYGMLCAQEADLRGAASLAEVGRRLRTHAEKLALRPGDGRWLLGRGFEQDRLAEGRWPSRHDLDQIAAQIPLRITRVCGHALVANTAALRSAGLDPAGSQEDGFPEGVLTEERQGAIYRAVPDATAADWRAAARRACAEAARAGFVGVHSLMADEREVRALIDLRREGPLPVRVLMQLPYSMLEHAAGIGLRTGYGGDYLSIGAIKLFSDGSLGARTAALLEPYTDDPTTVGELIYPPDELARRVQRVHAAGFQVCIHAIGDRAMETTLDAIESAVNVHGPWSFPPRIEHASLVNPRILARMRSLGVGAAIQPQFARSDYWAPERLGSDRARGCYAFHTLAEAGIPLAGSTDCPVEELDAMAAIGQAVTRPEWSPQESLPLDRVLRLFSEGAYALRGFPPGTGRLAPGQAADFVVLEADPRRAPPAEIERIPVFMTVVGGETASSAS